LSKQRASRILSSLFNIIEVSPSTLSSRWTLCRGHWSVQPYLLLACPNHWGVLRTAESAIRRLWR